jgi:hypothetical protein
MSALYKILLPLIFTLLFTVLASPFSFSQETVVNGVIRDAVTKESIPYASIFFNGTKAGTQSNLDGNYTISASQNYSMLKISYMGYETVLKNIIPGKTQTLDIWIKPNAKALNQVVVVAGKKPRYVNKENPAVELIRKVIAQKDQNRLSSYQTASYRQYEKMFFSVSNVSDKFKDRKIFKNYQFLFQEQDSTQIGGKNILPIYIQEKLSDEYFSKSLGKSKSNILAEKQAQFDSKLIDNNGIKVYFDRMYEPIDIYENNISLMTNEFLSPIANNGPAFYKYFITDTLKDQYPQVIELSFTPRNTTDMLFEGQIYITMDGNYAVQKAVLNVNRKINLNFVRAIRIDLLFNQHTDQRFYLSKTNLVADFGISKNKGMGFTGERTVSFNNYQTNITLPDSIFKDKPLALQASVPQQSESFWQENRLEAISEKQLSIYHNIDTLQNIPSFKRTAKIVTLFFAGFQDLGPYEIGPVNTFYSFNNVEGFRLRVGGRTTTSFSKRFYFENYAAYGFKDEKWKYFLGATYSLNNKSIYSFPQNYIRASFQRDTKIPGQELQFVQEDNFLLSFKRGVNDMLLYNDFYRIDYIKEFENHFSYGIGFKKWTQTPAGGLFYTNGISNENIRSLSTSEVSLQLRYAPNEKFYQGKLYRLPFTTKYPVFNLTYTAGIKGVFNGEYNYHNLMGSVEKRIYLSQLGFSDVIVEGGYIAGKVPFPLLAIHRANQTYAFQLKSYNMMNFLEFVSDHYASINIDHHFNGFFLNKLPLIKKLKLREIVSFKGLYGGLRHENKPSLDDNLYQLPVYENGEKRTYSLEKAPYMEGSVGLGNIFKLFRVDLLKRFNYLNHPEVAEWGVRASFKFDF